ncbi:hypothetical protein LXL04_030558 [Taraxacum kok-saghyz]
MASSNEILESNLATTKNHEQNGELKGKLDDYPTGEFEFKKSGTWKSLMVKLRLLTAYPWERVRHGSVLNIKLRGKISDQVKSRFSSGLSLPQICENLIKAAYDPRISGVYLHIETLSCGWGKIEEVRRHILDFRKSGKFIIAYAPVWHEKGYYLGCACEELYAPPSAYFSLYGFKAQASFIGGVLEKVGVEPQIERIGKYKSMGDRITRKNISEEDREVLTTLVDNVYENWVNTVSQSKGKKKEDIESFINEGVYQVEKLKEGGWITDIKYEDEVTSILKKKLGISEKKKFPLVSYKKYSGVRKWRLGLTGGKHQIAVIRASGSISRTGGSFFEPKSGIVAEKFIEKIRKVKKSKRYKAVIIRIDSPGGEALASDLMWREICLLAESKPVIASMVDMAASGGYYMAMAAQTIVSENLTLTGSIGVVKLKFNFGKLHELIGFNNEIISKGRFADLYAADRPFRPDEEKLFALSAQNIYKQFRDKAASSRSMSVDKMEKIAQGRVWTVDAIGGFSRAVAIAKHKANIPHHKKVTLVELSKESLSLPQILFRMMTSAIGLDGTTSSDGVQARMDGATFQGSEGSLVADPVFNVLKDYLSFLRLMTAYPWERVGKGSVLNIKLRGKISDHVMGRFSSGLSLPQICENLIKATYDPRISGVYFHIETLKCGWGKVEEIRRHILDFKKSGKFIVGYAPVWHEKEYYIGCACDELYAPPSAYFSLYGFKAQASFIGGVLEKVGVEPQVQRIGKYKSFGDRITRKNISEENREVLTTLVDNIYENWVDKICQSKGKKKEDIESFINEGVYQIEKLKEDGWITDIKYDDEVTSMLKKKLGIADKKKLPLVSYKKYSGVRKWRLGLTGGKDRIAVIRASGSISRVGGSIFEPNSGIIAEKFIEKIRNVRESKRYKAVIIRIDSPGGDGLASDLMWREISVLAECKPVIASMVDVAASGGYEMAMAAHAIVSENLTLTGSIGVVAAKFNFGKLHERIGFNNEIISKGRFADFYAADRPFRPDEEKLFAEYVQNSYKQFRDKAASSRSMSVDKMEEIAQGRVWTGKDAVSRGLVDAIGGFSRAVAIAKHKANIPHHKKVTLVELSKESLSLPQILFRMMTSAIGVDRSTSSDGVQARMDGDTFQGSEGSLVADPIFGLLKDYLSFA